MKTRVIILNVVLFTLWDYGEVQEFDYMCPSMIVTFIKLL